MKLNVELRSMILLILIVATIISTLLGEVLDAFAILVIVLIMGVFGFVQEYRAEKTVELLRKLTSPKCRVLRDGLEVEVSASHIVLGDIILLREGYRV